MPDDSRHDTGDRRRSARTLARIAETLNQPRHVFLDGTAPVDLAGGAELLHHWYGLANDADRRKVLAFVRAVASAKPDRCGMRE